MGMKIRLNFSFKYFVIVNAMVNRIEKMKKEWEMAVDTLSLIRWQNSKRIWQKKISWQNAKRIL